MVDPGEEWNVILNDSAEAFIGIGTIGRDVKTELGDEAGMVEVLLFLGAQVSLGAGKPKQVAVEHDFLPTW